MTKFGKAILVAGLSVFLSECGGDLVPAFPTETPSRMLLHTPALYSLGGTASSEPSIAIGDVNQDGISDVVVGMSNGTVQAFIGRGSGAFDLVPLTYQVGATPAQILITPLTHASTNDMAVADSSATEVSVLIHASGGTFSAPVNYTVGTEPVQLIAANIDGSGLPSLLALNEGSNNVSVLMEESGSPGTYAAAVNYATGGSGPTAFCMADFNRDGVSDLAVLNQASNTISILLGVTGGTFDAAVVYGPFTATLEGIGCGDFNGDGKPDVVFSTTNGGAQLYGTVNLLAGNGDGTLAAPNAAYDFPAGKPTGGLVVGDFDGSGRLDVMVADPADAVLNVLWGESGGLFSTMQSYPAALAGDGVAEGNLVSSGEVDWVTVPASGTAMSVLLGY